MSKIFIYSENLRGRRPVTGRIAGKDPCNPEGAGTGIKTHVSSEPIPHRLA